AYSFTCCAVASTIAWKVPVTRPATNPEKLTAASASAARPPICDVVGGGGGAGGGGGGAFASPLPEAPVVPSASPTAYGSWRALSAASMRERSRLNAERSAGFRVR